MTVLIYLQTTSNSLAYLTHFLANYPDVQERMREEIEAVCLNEVRNSVHLSVVPSVNAKKITGEFLIAKHGDPRSTTVWKI